MNHILELDRRNLTVTVEPGVLLMELAQYVEENGLFYPPDPGEKSATIGGNISTNAGGMRAVKYGVTRDYVRALTVVLPTGEVVEFGGKTVKNSSGYSLLNLMIGSEGTLGVITRAVLKLVPLPGKTVSLLVPFADMEQAIEMVPVIVEAQIQATAIEFMERETILFAEEYLGKRFPDTRNDAYILLTFDGRNAEQVRAEYQEVADLFRSRELPGIQEQMGMQEAGIQREKAGKAMLPDSSRHLGGAEYTVQIMEQAPVVIFVLNPLGKGMFSPLNDEDRIYELCNICLLYTSPSPRD